MKPKTLRISYWVVTILFVFWLIGDGAGGVTQAETGRALMVQLGYPMYFLIILGASKFFAAAAILQNHFRTIKEWAYAGYAITCVSAFASRAFIHDGLLMILLPFFFLGFMFISYCLWNKAERAGVI